MKKWLLQGSEGILSALTPAAEIAAPRGRVTLPRKTQEKKLLTLGFTKNGAGRSMDGLDQDDPATGIGPARWLLKTWNRMFQGRTGTASPSYGEEGALFFAPGGDE
jgi:hypothetical protein